ncbi:hypothetical protein C8R44DRAFT_894381 [Mycena epipterygia]|nr:hypothetical protein C8R44DRAFT_894381 [Mycena epipterygia]
MANLELLSSNVFESWNAEDAKEHHAHWRQIFWNGLPVKFDLPDWDQLEAMQQTALA